MYRYHKICRKYGKKIRKYKDICLKYAFICTKHALNMPRLSRLQHAKYEEYIFKICRHMQDICKSFAQHAQNMHKISIKYA